jgi:hypothetical protein
MPIYLHRAAAASPDGLQLCSDCGLALRSATALRGEFQYGRPYPTGSIVAKADGAFQALALGSPSEIEGIPCLTKKGIVKND